MGKIARNLVTSVLAVSSGFVAGQIGPEVASADPSVEAASPQGESNTKPYERILKDQVRNPIAAEIDRLLQVASNGDPTVVVETFEDAEERFTLFTIRRTNADGSVTAIDGTLKGVLDRSQVTVGNPRRWRWLELEHFYPGGGDVSPDNPYGVKHLGEVEIFRLPFEDGKHFVTTGDFGELSFSTYLGGSDIGASPLENAEAAGYITHVLLSQVD